jgi:hypothetical protein
MNFQQTHEIVHPFFFKKHELPPLILVAFQISLEKQRIAEKRYISSST